MNPAEESPNPDKCAVRAEEAFRELARIGRRQIDSALRVGELMLKAKAQLPHGKFGAAFRRWRSEGVITFSDRSKNRWMLMATQADAIKSANLANLREAEQLAQRLAAGLSQEEKSTTATELKASALTAEDALGEFEQYLLTVLRKLAPAEHIKFLEEISAMVSRRLEACRS